jgi:hypothetical protein
MAGFRDDVFNAVCVFLVGQMNVRIHVLHCMCPPPIHLGYDVLYNFLFRIYYGNDEKPMPFGGYIQGVLGVLESFKL